jgi:hypothetical protein
MYVDAQRLMEDDVGCASPSGGVKVIRLHRETREWRYDKLGM